MAGEASPAWDVTSASGVASRDKARIGEDGMHVVLGEAETLSFKSMSATSRSETVRLDLFRPQQHPFTRMDR